jgi:sulfate transport system permease protein
MRPLINRSPLPGMRLSAGITLTMLSLVVLLPIGALLLKGATAGLPALWTEVNTPRIWGSLALSFRLSLIAALINLVFGLLLAWVLVRYRFPGRKLLDLSLIHI